MQPAVSRSKSRYLHTDGKCNLLSKKIRRCSHYIKSSCRLKEKTEKSMSSIDSPEKTDPKTPSAIVNTSTHSGNVNLNVVLNRVQN